MWLFAGPRHYLFSQHPPDNELLFQTTTNSDLFIRPTFFNTRIPPSRLDRQQHHRPKELSNTMCALVSRSLFPHALAAQSRALSAGPPRHLSFRQVVKKHTRSLATVASNDRYWQRVPMWKDVEDKDFLSYEWQVRGSASHDDLAQLTALIAEEEHHRSEMETRTLPEPDPPYPYPPCETRRFPCRKYQNEGRLPHGPERGYGCGTDGSQNVPSHVEYC